MSRRHCHGYYHDSYNTTTLNNTLNSIIVDSLLCLSYNFFADYATSGGISKVPVESCQLTAKKENI